MIKHNQKKTDPKGSKQTVKKISVTIHNGKIAAVATGYIGRGCETPIEAVKHALGGDIKKEEATAEASLTEDTLTQENSALA